MAHPRVLRSTLVAVASALGAMCMASTTSAAVFSWDGGGTSNDWSDAANWLSNTVPAPGDILSFGGLSPDTVFAFNDLGTFHVNVLTLTSAAPPELQNFVIQGDPLLISGGIRRGTATQTVMNAVTLLNSQTWESLGTTSGELRITGPVTLSSHTLTLEGAGAFNISGTMSGTGHVVKSGAGTLAIAGVNTYSGTTTVAGGTLALNVAGALNATSKVTVASGATLALGAADAIANGAPVTVDGGTFALGSFSDTTSTLTLLSGNVTGSGVLRSSIFKAFDVQSGAISAGLGGSGALVKSTAGTVTLSGANTYSGGTTISGGTLAIASDANLGAASGSLTMNGGTLQAGTSLTTSRATTVGAGGGTFEVVGSPTRVVHDGTISGSGGIIKEGFGTLVLGGANSYQGGTTVNGGALEIGSDSNLGAVSAPLVLDGGSLKVTAGGSVIANRPVALLGDTPAISVEGGAFLILGGTVSGGDLRKGGEGLLALSGAMQYTGDTLIFQGTLRPSGSEKIPDLSAVTVDDRGILEISQTETVGSLSGRTFFGRRGTVLAHGHLIVGANDASTEFEGVITSLGDVTKIGGGTLTLSGQNSYLGSTSVEGGVLALPNGLAAAGEAITIASGAELRAAGLVGRAITGPGTVSASGALILGALDEIGVSFDGVLDTGAHVVQLAGSGQSSLGGTVNLAGGGRLTSLDQGAGIVLDGGTVNASGSGWIDSDFVNSGVVNGPTGLGETLTFTDDVTGAGSYSGNVTFADGFSPGASPATILMGSATFDASSSLLMEIGELAHDKLVLSGKLTLEGGLLTVALLDGYAPAGGEVFDLFDFASLAGAGFGRIALPTLGSGLSWNTASLYDDGTLSVAAIPEPETYALMLAGLGLLGFATRRRRREREPACAS